MTSKSKASLVIVGVTVLTCALSVISSFHSHQWLVQNAEQRELKSIVTFIQNDLQDLNNKAAARASLVCSLPSIKAAFRSNDRDQLAQRLVPAFLIQREKFGVREGQFHLPPATSFLRVFDLKAPQEDLSGFREMVLATNRKQEPQKGIEIGRRGLSIRGIDLVKDEKGPIGSFEVGMSFTTLLTDIKANTGFEAGAFVDDKLMSTIATEIRRPDNEHIIGEFQSVDSTNWQAIRGASSADLLAKANDIVCRVDIANGVERGLVLVPMLDFQGKQIGSILAVGSFETFQTELKAALAEILFSTLLQGIAFAGTGLIVLNGTLAHQAATSKKEVANV